MEPCGLFYQHKKHGALRVVNPDEVKTILKACHEDPLSGHQGINRTWEKVKTRYYWPSIQKDVEQHVRECDPCQRQNHLTKTPSTLHPIPVKNKAFSMLGMDLVRPFRETARGNKYVIVLTDYLTKWPEVKAIPTKSGEEIATFVIETVSRHGTPEVILTDNGKEFCNELNDTLCRWLGIEHRVTTPYHPQTNGLTERNNQTLCSALTKYVNDTQDDWDLYIHQIALAMRTCRQSSTKKTPFFLTYGREAVLPIQLDIPTSLDTGKDVREEDFQELVDDRAASFAELLTTQRKAKKEIVKAQVKQKKFYDQKHQSEGFNIGDKVLLKNKKKINRKGDKIQTRWTGPYTVKASIGKGVYHLYNKKAKVNIKNMKKYITPTPEPDKQQPSNDTKHCRVKRKQKHPAKLQTLPSRRKKYAKHLSRRKLKNVTKEKNIKTFFYQLKDTTKQHIFNECSKIRISRPKGPQSAETAAMESPTYSLVMDADKRFGEDVMDCHNELLSWYMTSNIKNLGTACSLDPFLLSSSFLTTAFHDSVNPIELLETLKNVPLSQTSTTISPCKLPKMSVQMNIGNVTLQRQDLRTLYQKQWLNDQVIHAYLGVLQSEYNTGHAKGCYVLPCFLAAKWESGQYNAWLYPQIPLEDFHHILLPVCHQQHWFLLVGTMATKTVTIYDSLPCQARKERFCRHWMNFMAARKDKSVWKVGKDKSSKQQDGHSCGVFVLMNAEALLNDSSPTIMRQCHTQSYRRHILKRLLAEASPHNNTSCDLPYCFLTTHQPRQQCFRCSKWFHKKCLGLTHSQTVKSCVFCSRILC